MIESTALRTKIEQYLAAGADGDRGARETQTLTWVVEGRRGFVPSRFGTGMCAND
jgi:hypothetical protein